MSDSQKSQASITFFLNEDGDYSFKHEAHDEMETILLVSLLTDLKLGKLYNVALECMTPEAEILIEGAFWGEEPPLVDLSEEDDYEDG